MIYVVLGIVILCASFLIALITLIREQKKIDGEIEDAQAGRDSPNAGSLDGSTGLTTKAPLNPQQYSHAQDPGQGPSFIESDPLTLGLRLGSGTHPINSGSVTPRPFGGSAELTAMASLRNQSSGQGPSVAEPFDGSTGLTTIAPAQDKSAQVIDSEVAQTRGGLQQDTSVDEERVQITNKQESQFPWEERAQARQDLASKRESIISNTNRINGVIIPRDISEKK